MWYLSTTIGCSVRPGHMRMVPLECFAWVAAHSAVGWVSDRYDVKKGKCILSRHMLYFFYSLCRAPRYLIENLDEDKTVIEVNHFIYAKVLLQIRNWGYVYYRVNIARNRAWLLSILSGRIALS